jgi:hypothetical protein
MLERFRAVRDELELRMKAWLEHPEGELARLREERDRERRERLEAERQRAATPVGGAGDGGRDPFRRV